MPFFVKEAENCMIMREKSVFVEKMGSKTLF